MRATGTIVILAKAPVAGTVKTRLIPMLSVTQAAAVYSAMLADVVRAAGEVPGARLVVCLRGAPAPPLPAAVRLLVQRGPDLAHSIANGFVDVADRWGPGPCVLITSDIPTVRAADIQAVLNCLDEADVGFGPSPDGGFWGLAMSDPGHAEAVRTVPMSTGSTGGSLLRRLRERGCEVRLGPSVADVDTWDDLSSARRRCSPDSSFARSVDRVLLESPR